MFGNKVYFKKAKIPSKKKLNGKYCFLEPVNNKKHSKDLFKNFSLDKKGVDWTYMPTGPYKTEKSLKKYLKAKNFTGNPFFYAIYSKRLQIQERMTKNIADELYSHGVKGVAVITEAELLCMKLSGVKNNASVSSAAFRGIYEKKEEKENIINIIKNPSKTFFTQNS